MSEYFLADDLSGALDAAAAFRAAGWRVTIAWTREAWPVAAPGEIVGFSTETRNAAPAAAWDTVRLALLYAETRGARLVYKKIDSTLRGQVAAELRATLAALPAARVLFTPANPKVGRTVRDGILYVHGVPVAETEFARDPQSPVRESSIARLLDAVMAKSGGRLRIADADAEADLTAAVADFAAEPGPWFAVGSGALAKPVAARLAAQLPALPARLTAAESGVSLQPPPAGPLLFVCGSAHPANRVQAAALARGEGLPVHEVPVLPPEVAAAAGAAPLTIPPPTLLDPITDSLRQNGAAALCLETPRRDPAAALATIAAVAAAAIERARVTRVFVTGGETAFALCGALGVKSLVVESEIEPGLVLARTQGARDLWLAVKPGGFGDEATWRRGWRALGGDGRTGG